ncbi:uncharacterized protein A4U43_C07F28380 [Asparagus officinalis]|uniref:HPP transmembrane region domain-containing protein n=1 Tax=Asparagus officinalis TaxID=4686 RepID=A0A5P1EIN4_ASPOF|nr:uncharacterized protein LOC109851001 [Asparagus officinalis]ONK64649.1 uncharacterized protein A4U43_C07F28380 [Asparagus officinalis]
MALKTQSPTSTCNYPSTLLLRSSSLISSLSNGNRNMALGVRLRNEEKRSRLVVQSSGSSGSLGGEKWGPKPSTFPDSVPCLSDILWPSAGAFAAMAALGRMDQMLASRGLSITIAPLGAVCAVLFAAPNSPAAKKYNIFVAQIGCAAFGVLALSMFGPGWLARAASLAASIAFMVATGSLHPPAASLPILFIDGAKFHSLNLWYTLFPGAAGCLVLCLIQEIVTYLKQNCKF